MSIPRYSPNPLWFGMPILDNKEGKLCEYRHYVKLEAENATLKAEVKRLTKRNQHLEQIDSYLQSANLNAEEQRSMELEAQVERLTKAGDAMVEELNGRYFGKRLINDWNAAKEGKQS